MKKYTDENYDLMDENEKFAMRYGAEGRHLGDVIRDNPRKITNPDKMLEAWDKGMNMRKDGTSKVFLDDIEKKERENLLSSKSPNRDGNGIESEPVRDMWGNDLSKDSSFGNSEDFTFDLSEEKIHNPKEDNYLLKTDENYGKMYATNYSNEVTPVKTKDGKTHVTYGCEDVNVVGGIQLRLNEMNYKGKNGEPIGITGTFDENTEEGIKQFQKERGLPVTGIFDDATKKEMGFAEDYSISRKGKNATPWNLPFSPPFNLEQYNKEQEKRKAEKEQRIKEEKEAEKDNVILRPFKRGLGAALGFYGDYVKGVCAGVQEASMKDKEEEEYDEIPDMYPGEALDNYVRRIGS